MNRKTKPTSNTYDFNKEKRKRERRNLAQKSSRTTRPVRPSTTRSYGNRGNVRVLHPNRKVAQSRQSQKARVGSDWRKLIRQPVYLASICSALVLLIGGVIFAATYKNAQEVYLDEIHIGTVWGKRLVAEDLQNVAVGKLEADLGAKVLVNETVSLNLVHAQRAGTVVTDTINAALADAFTYKVQAAQIRVDGTPFGIVRSVEEAERIQQEIKYARAPAGEEVVSSHFLESVTVATSFVDPSEVMSRERVLDILTAKQEVRETYTAVSGDAFWTIANRFSMSLDDLLEINGLEADAKLNIGQTLEVILYKPLLSITTITEYKIEKTEPKTIIERENHDEPRSYANLIQAGKDGQVEVTIRRTFVDGILTSEEEYSRQVLLEPVDEIIEVGTQ